MAKGGKQSLVVASKIKGLIKKSKMKCSSDVMGAITQMIEHHLGKACGRAKANGRKTVRGSDL